VDWNIEWIIAGGVAVGLLLLNIIRTALGKPRGWQLLMFGSMAFGLLTLLLEYGMVLQWLRWGEMALLENTVPAVYPVLSIGTAVGIAANFILLIFHLRREDQEKKQPA